MLDLRDDRGPLRLEPKVAAHRAACHTPRTGETYSTAGSLEPKVGTVTAPNRRNRICDPYRLANLTNCGQVKRFSRAPTESQPFDYLCGCSPSS